MKPRPPHLPKENILPARQTEKHSFFYFFSCTFISIAASLSTVFVAISWIVPRAVPEVQFYSFQHETPSVVPVVNAELATRMSEREARLYDKKNKLGSHWYPMNSDLSSGVFLTSDGWAVFPLEENFDEIQKKNISSFEVLDNRGVLYSVSKIVFDKNFHLLYAQVSGTGFRFVSFPNSNVFKTDTLALTKKYGQYEISKVLETEKNTDEAAFEIWKSPRHFALEKMHSGLVFTDQGELLALSQNNTLVPAWYIEAALSSLLSKQTISYAAFPWKGNFVDQTFENGFVKALNGFFITDIAGDKTKNTLKVGDVITKVQNEAVTPINLSHLLLQGSDPVSFEFIRDGKTLQITLPKQTLNF